MKKLLFLFVGFLPILLSAQTDFEGIIIYKGSKTAPKNDFRLKLYLSKGRMKAKITDQEVTESGTQQIHIYNFNTGIHYIIDDNAKTFAIDSLDNKSYEDHKTRIKDTSLFENILDYPCKGYNIFPTPESFMDDWKSIAWYSDSLKFTVPEKYRGKRSIEALPNGNMLFLKTIMIFHLDYGDPAIKAADSFTVVIDKIEKIGLSESEFLPPADYTLITTQEIQGTYQDHLIISDSVNVKEITLTELKKEETKKTPSKTTTPSKSPAKKEKIAKPVKG